jgi:hypothetical protein
MAVTDRRSARAGSKECERLVKGIIHGLWVFRAVQERQLGSRRENAEGLRVRRTDVLTFQSPYADVICSICSPMTPGEDRR